MSKKNLLNPHSRRLRKSQETFSNRESFKNDHDDLIISRSPEVLLLLLEQLVLDHHVEVLVDEDVIARVLSEVLEGELEASHFLFAPLDLAFEVLIQIQFLVLDGREVGNPVEADVLHQSFAFMVDLEEFLIIEKGRQFYN